MRRLIDFLFSGSNNPKHQRIVIWMWYAVFAGLGIGLLTFVILSFSNLPSVKQLENPKFERASEIYGINGEVIGRYYTENRVPVNYDSLSPHLIAALISTEDARYYQHAGIDFRGLARVAVKTIILRQRSAGGASTITQQLAKLLFTGTPGSGLERVIQKFKEWIIAVRLERKYTKEEIIAMYLNKFDFINGAYGIKAASEIYFNTSPKDLSITEAATLVGMLQNPSLYNPLRRPEITLKRREVVLKQMVKYGHISNAAYEALRKQPLELDFQRVTHIDGIATYFRMELAKDLKAILDLPENHKSDGTSYNIYNDGLKIYTTIDPEMQSIAERVMVEHMENVQKVFWKEWKGKDLWSYDTGSEDEVSLEIRQETLTRLVRESDRYQKFRNRYLSKILGELNEDHPDFSFHNDDREVARMVAEYKRPGTLERLVREEIISSDLAKSYRRIIRNRSFPELLTQWEEMQDEVKRDFNTPVKMQVFAYNKKMEVDTVMSPIDSIKYHRNFLQTGILAVDPRTGYVKVWVGGINHKYFQFDHVRTRRQVGSTFKPFVYVTAIAQQGFSPCFKVYDLPQTIQPGDGSFYLQKAWTPRNFDGKYSGELLTLRDGLRRSKNTISVYLMKQLTDTEPVRGLINQMGIDSSARHPNGRYVVPQTPSIALGATDLTVMEMTGAYATFANNGTYNRPIYIARIEDKNGRIIYKGIPEERQAINPSANYVMVDMLRYAGRVGGVRSDVGGKTGTTNNYVDGWFMGITPSLVVGTWVGGEDRFIHFRTPWNGQGSRMAKPFFQAFLKELEKSETADYNVKTRFYRPPGELGIEIDCSEYQDDGIDMEEDPYQEDDVTEDMFGDEAQFHIPPSARETDPDSRR